MGTQEESQEKKPEQSQEQPQEQSKETKPVDLVTRVSQVKNAEPKKEEGKFNINELDSEIEKIQDPAVKEQILGLKKSLISGENQKYQDIANLRKEYETKLAESTTWTPERIKSEMNKPDFVQAAQAVLGSGNAIDEGSALSDKEQERLNQLQGELKSLKQANWQAHKANQDAVLKNKYANYAPDMIDTVTQELMTGKRLATREDIHKVIDYEKAVQRAYALGLEDKKTQTTEKLEGMTIDGGGNQTQPTTLERQKGESTQKFIRRSYQTHSAKK